MINIEVIEVKEVKEDINAILPNDVCTEYSENEYECSIECDYEYNKKLYSNVHKYLGVGELHTYKTLCVTLQEKHLSGNSKTKHLKELSRYFDFYYDEDIKRYVIREIYDIPLPPLSAANVLYAHHIKAILLTYLATHANNEEKAIYISSQYLYQTLGMINHQYIEMKNKDRKGELRDSLRKELENKNKGIFFNIEDKTLNFYIKNFYDRCRSKFAAIIDSSLKSLDKQNYLTHCKAYNIYEKIFDDEGKDTGKSKLAGNSSDAETQDFLTIEREIMDEFGFKTDQDIWFGGQTEAYWGRVNEEIQILYPEINHVYRCHKIICSKENALKALNQEQVSKEKYQLNEKILKYIDTQAENNVGKSIEKNPDDETKHLSNRYVDAQKYLSNKLIKITENN